MSASSSQTDAVNFTVSIDGVPVASFAECILPSATIEVIEYREGADEVSNVHKLPGLVKYGDLILKRGMAGPPTGSALWDWFSTFVDGTGTPKSLTVTLMDSKRVPAFTWSFTNAWPVKYESPVLNGRTSALAIETLEIAVEGMKLTLGQ
jgi:phage tail-like protein